MARLPDAFIDDLLARTDIVEVVGSRVPLKRQGKEYASRCPFHDERSASFTVSPTKQFYHCFGCGAHGTAISFLMNYDRLEFLDAVDELAKRVGMEAMAFFFHISNFSRGIFFFMISRTSFSANPNSFFMTSNGFFSSKANETSFSVCSQFNSLRLLFFIS